MANKLYVGNLSYDTSEEQLHTLCSEIGPVASVALITDRQTGQSKGFAFIEMQNTADAQSVIERLNNREVDGRSLTVNEARPRSQDFGDGNSSRGRDNRSPDRRRRY